MNFIITAFAISSIVTFTGCKTLDVPTSWAENAIPVDGKLSGWENIPSTYFEKQEAALGLSNDNENLYIIFRFRDSKWLPPIKMTGLTFYINDEGKKNKDIYFRYNGGPSMPEGKGPEGKGGPGRGGRTGGQMPEMTQSRQGQVAEPTPERFVYMNKKTRGFEKSLPLNGSGGPAVAYDTTMGFYAYEFSIPLAEAGEDIIGLGLKPGQVIAIGAEWGDMGEAAEGVKGGGGPGGGGGMPGGGMPGGGGGMPGGGPGGGGMPPSGGGMPGGGPGGGGMQAQDMPEKQEVWIKTKLAIPGGVEQAVESTDR